MMEWITANISLAFKVEIIKSGASEWNAHLNPGRKVWTTSDCEMYENWNGKSHSNMNECVYVVKFLSFSSSVLL